VHAPVVAAAPATAAAAAGGGGATHKVGVGPILVLGGLCAAAYEHLPKPALAELAVYIVLWAAPHLDLHKQIGA
jgi:hypothetical protein